MTYFAYKWIHLVSLISTFVLLGISLGLNGLGMGLNAQGKPRLNITEAELKKINKYLGMLHGISLFFILLGGFGLMARLNISHAGWPAWIWAKFALWLLLGAALVWIKRVNIPHKTLITGIALVVTGALGGYLALWKPF